VTEYLESTLEVAYSKLGNKVVCIMVGVKALFWHRRTTGDYNKETYASKWLSFIQCWAPVKPSYFLKTVRPWQPQNLLSSACPDDAQHVYNKQLAEVLTLIPILSAGSHRSEWV